MVCPVLFGLIRQQEWASNSLCDCRMGIIQNLKTLTRFGGIEKNVKQEGERGKLR